jgi:hypothetical protein
VKAVKQLTINLKYQVLSYKYNEKAQAEYKNGILRGSANCRLYCSSKRRLKSVSLSELGLPLNAKIISLALNVHHALLAATVIPSQ